MGDPLVIDNIADGLFMLRPKNPMWPSSANVFVIMENDDEGNDGHFSMIDVGCGKEEAVVLVKDALANLDISIKNLKTLVLSHAHPDHTGGVGRFLDGATPEILIHENDFPNTKDPTGLIDTFDIEFAKRFYSDKGGKASAMANLMSFFNDFGCPMFGATPTGKLIGGDVVKLGNYHFEVILTPGHSPGHISLFDSKTKIMYGGDLVGDIVAWYTPASGGVIEYLKSLDKMEAKSPKIILPSHGEAVTNPKVAIAKVRERLYAREKKMVEILNDSPKTFVELVDLMFKVEMMRFFPGAGITESHILKLREDGRVRRVGETVELT
jgi:glyoxylase-like metal-dependent hydrolase (beta-lactamase superfamily II)